MNIGIYIVLHWIYFLSEFVKVGLTILLPIGISKIAWPSNFGNSAQAVSTGMLSIQLEFLILC